MFNSMASSVGRMCIEEMGIFVRNQHFFFNIIELLRGLRDEQLRMMGFERESLELDQVRNLVFVYPELLNINTLVLDTLPVIIRDHIFTLNELHPLRCVLFLYDIQMFVMNLQNQMLSDITQFELARYHGVDYNTYRAVRLFLTDSGHCSCSSSLSSDRNELSFNFRIELKEFPNVEKAFLTKRPIPKPKPAVLLIGNDTAINRRSLRVGVSLVNFYTNEVLEEDSLTHNDSIQIVSGQCVSFTKLTINKTSKSYDDCLFCLQFDLRYSRNYSAKKRVDGTKEEEPSYQILHTIRSKAFRTISHAESIYKDPVMSIPPPTLFEIIPNSICNIGEMKLAILGKNFVNQPLSLKIIFGGSWGVPQFQSPRTLICIPPRMKPGDVDVAVSNDGVQWSNSLRFTVYCCVPDGVVEIELGKLSELHLNNVF